MNTINQKICYQEGGVLYSLFSLDGNWTFCMSMDTKDKTNQKDFSDSSKKEAHTEGKLHKKKTKSWTKGKKQMTQKISQSRRKGGKNAKGVDYNVGVQDLRPREDPLWQNATEPPNNFNGTEFESLHNVSQNTSQEKNLSEKDNFSIPGHEEEEEEEDPEEIQNLEEKRQEFDETKFQSIHSNGLEWKRSEVGNINVTSHQKKSVDESKKLLGNIHAFNETVHSSGQEGKPTEKKVGGQNIQTEQKGDSNKNETFNEAKFASVHEIGVDPNDPVKKSSKPLPVDEKVDERTREHFFSKHLLNATEESQVGNKTEEATNQGKNHSVMWTKHVSVVLPKSKKSLQKKREQIKSVKSAAVKTE